MSLQLLTNAGDAKKVIASLKRNMTRQYRSMRRFIGWQSGGRNFHVRWIGEVSMWWTRQRSSGVKRCICFLDFQDPTRSNDMTIICEINPSCMGPTRRTPGTLSGESILGDNYILVVEGTW